MPDPTETVGRYFVAFAAGDVERALRQLADDCAWHVDGDPIVGTVGIVRGKDAVRHWLTRFPQIFQPLAFAVERLIGEGEDVVALGRFRHRVCATDAIVDSDYAIRFTIRDGLIARYQIYEDSLLLAQAFRSGAAGRSAELNGAHYGWDDLGQGPMIVFLHGLFLDRRFFDGQVRDLVTDYRCVAFDMPGHGESGWRDGLDLDGIAEDLALWIEEQRAGPVVLVGHSQGGMVAMRLGARRPELVERLVLVNTSARAEYPDRLPNWRALRASIADGTPEARRDAFEAVQRRTTTASWRDAHLQAAEAERATMARHDPSMLARALDAAVLDRRDIRPLLSRIEVSTAVLAGRLDEATPPELSEEIAAGIAGATLKVVDGTAHHLPVEATDAVCAGIRGQS
jgi:3-oxoadipate enol-lactonase